MANQTEKPVTYVAGELKDEHQVRSNLFGELHDLTVLTHRQFGL